MDQINLILTSTKQKSLSDYLGPQKSATNTGANVNMIYMYM